MRGGLKRVLQSLSLLVLHDAATAQTGKAAVPLFAWPDGSLSYGSRPLLRLAGRADPQPARTLDSLFMTASGPGRQHLQDATSMIGAVELTTAALRKRMLIATASNGRADLYDRLAAFGIQASGMLDDDDRVSIGIAARGEKRAEPAILAGHKSIDGRGIIADCTLLHGDRVRMSLAWHSDRSTTSRWMNRIVELAQGAALNERGYSATLSYLMSEATVGHETTMGLVASETRIANDDLAVLGFPSRQNVRAAIFLRTGF